MINLTVNNNNLSTRPSFKGVDARALKAIVVSDIAQKDTFGYVRELQKIGNKNGFEVWFAVQDKICKSISNAIKQGKKRGFEDIFIQDTLFCKPLANGKTQFVETGRLSGGNLYLIEKDNTKVILAGEDELSRLAGKSAIYGAKKIYSIPQADYHLDLFARPLKNGTILIPDDEMTLEQLKKGVVKINKYLKTCPAREKAQIEAVRDSIKETIKTFRKNIKLNVNPKADELEKSLKDNGFNPVRVPGRIYLANPANAFRDLKNEMNFINAFVHEKPDGSLVYVTAKSNMNEKHGITKKIEKKIGFGFEQMYKEALAPFVKGEDVHFVSGDNYLADVLDKSDAGLHCLVSEVF